MGSQGKRQLPQNHIPPDMLRDVVTEPKLSLNRQSGVVGRNTGNIVYRGESFPSLAGKLIFASTMASSWPAIPKKDPALPLLSESSTSAALATVSSPLCGPHRWANSYSLRRRKRLRNAQDSGSRKWQSSKAPSLLCGRAPNWLQKLIQNSADPDVLGNGITSRIL